eukprot:1626042-Prorocentrum_lima.AAC.1
MTSSLVGSEMCIRDSSTGFRSTPTQLCPLPPQCPPSTLAHPSRCPPPSSCLLYTSDAADDM